MEKKQRYATGGLKYRNSDSDEEFQVNKKHRTRAVQPKLKKLNEQEEESEYGEDGESEIDEKSEGQVKLDGTLNVVFQRSLIQDASGA